MPPQPVILCYLESDGALALEAVDGLRTVAPTEVLPMPTVAQVLETVEHTPGSAGLLPIEDSYEGEALSVYDRLVFESWHAYIRDEVVVSDSLDAFAVSPDAKEVAHTAVSSPRGIEHCFRFVQEQGLERPLRRLDIDGVPARWPPRATPASSPSPRRGSPTGFGLVTVAVGIEDLPDLKTRFIVVSREVAPPTGDDKTTLVVTPAVDRSRHARRPARGLRRERREHGVAAVAAAAGVGRAPTASRSPARATSPTRRCRRRSGGCGTRARASRCSARSRRGPATR